MRKFFFYILVIFLHTSCQTWKTSSPNKAHFYYHKENKESKKSDEDKNLIQAIPPLLEQKSSETHPPWDINKIKDIGKDGYVFYDLKNKQVLLSKNEKEYFYGASTFKVLSLAYVLKKLGPHFKFKTEIYTDGIVNNHVLKGNLVLKGNGDPELKLENLIQLVGYLKEKNIKSITGKFYYDESMFVARPVLSEDQPSQVTYNPGISALDFNYNVLTLHYKLLDSNNNYEYFVVPDILDIDEQNNDLVPDITNLKIQKNLPQSGIKYFTITDPALKTAMLFRMLASQRGIDLPTPFPGTINDKYEKIAEHQGPDLIRIIKKNLHTSINITTELLLLAATFKQERPVHDINVAADILKKWWIKNQIPDFRDLQIKNASGIGQNIISPSQMLHVIQHIFEQKAPLGENFFALFPISAHNGLLENRFLYPELALKILAKTGTLNYAIGLTGIFYLDDRRPILFSHYIQDSKKREKYDEILLNRSNDNKEQLIQEEKKALDWIKEARTYQDRFFLHILENFKR